MQRLAIIALLALVIFAGCSSDDSTPVAPRIDGPSDLRATALGATSIRINWTDNSFNENGFRVERAPAGVNTWTVLDTLEVDVVTFTDATVSEGTSYQYRVTAFIGRTLSTPAGPISVATPVVGPSGRPVCVRRSETSIFLSWTDASRVETSYIVERGLSQTTFEVVSTLPADSASLLDEGLTPGTKYYYRVKAIRDTISSAYSTIVNATTTVLRPSAPTGLTAAGGDNIPFKALLTWIDNAEVPEELGYVIEMSMTGNSNWVLADSVGAMTPRATIDSLTAEATIFFRLYAWNMEGNSDYSNVASCVISGPPAAPSDLIATAPNYFAVVLSWQDHATSERNFEVHRRLSTGQWSPFPVATLGVDVTQYNDSSANPNRTYIYRVRTINGAGVSAYSNEATVTTPIGPPVAPRNLIGTANGVDKINLQWEDMSDDEDHFWLERKGPGDLEFQFLTILPTNERVYRDTSLTPESWYYYRIRSHNGVGYSAFSNVDSTMTGTLTIFADGFEAYAADEPPPNPWQVLVGAAGSSWANVSTQRSHAPSAQSFQFHDPDPGANNLIQANLRSFNARDAVFTTWLFIPPNSAFGIIGVDRTDSIITWRTQFNTDRTLLVQSGSGVTQLDVNYPVATWFKLEVEFNSTSGYYLVRFDGVQQGDTLALVRANFNTVRLIMIAFSDTELPDGFVDDLSFVRSWQPGGAPARDFNRPSSPPFEGSTTVDGAMRMIQGWELHH